MVRAGLRGKGEKGRAIFREEGPGPGPGPFGRAGGRLGEQNTGGMCPAKPEDFSRGLS